MENKIEVSCRLGRPEDAKVIVEFQQALAWESENLRLDPETCKKGVQAVFERPHLGQYYIAEFQEKKVGSLLIIPEWSDWRNGMVWWIHSVYVIPTHRKQGVFTQLYRMLQVKGEATEEFRGLRHYVDKTNTRAQTVYRNLGMTNHHYELFEKMRTF